MYISPRLEQLKAHCGRTIILPYALTIVDCHFLSQALASLNPEILLSEVDGRVGARSMRSVFDLYAFDRELDDEEAILLHRESGSFLYWDERERFVAAGGSVTFCDLATPYPADVLKHYYVEGMSPSLSDTEAKNLYTLLAGV